MCPSTAGDVEAVRAFNRLYTPAMGLLREGLLDSPYTLTEARVIFELGRRDALDAGELRRLLGLDAGYLSRVLTRLEAAGVLERRRDARDGRRRLVRLTERGREAWAMLDERSARDVAGLLDGLGEDGRARLVGAMAAITGVLEPRAAPAAFVLRAPRPGELGWIVARHGALYAEQFGWDERFEALVARVIADFAAGHDARREAAWIAEVDGAPAGCVLCVEAASDTAQLRLLLVEPWARGRSVGARLVEECVRFARRAGYARIVLWTNDVLTSARAIYEAAGFELVDAAPHRDFGPEVVGQHWARAL
jgi:DNA-binding MarR family transcriptional regulator/N-acetylglutamate synthase-like GNAT family acetyltransferase